MRLDHYLVEIGKFSSRARAQAAIKAGLVSVNGAIATKAAGNVASDATVDVTGDVHPFVSRGGVKLIAILEKMALDVTEKICLDLGASTGGFTEVLLQNGAKKIFAVDVGSGQLHPKVANDDRVINLEKTHAKDLTRAIIPEPIEIIVCDVSFISLKKALPPALDLCAVGARLAALVKPQFEVGRSQIGKGGLVKPGEANSVGVAEDMCEWISAQSGWQATGFIESPITGGDGNREFLLGAVKIE